MRRLTTAAALLVCAAALAVETAPAGQPAPAPAPAGPKVLVTTLENGMDVILAERHAAPVCTVQVWVRCGSMTEENLLGAGVSHYVEHMLFKGTQRRGVRQMDREIRAAGGDHNAYTATDRTVYHVTLPSRNFDVALDCLADAVMHSKFDPGDCEREREVIIKEIARGEDSPGDAFYKHIRRVLYKRHPRRHPVIGYRNLFEKITRDELVGYYRKHYVPNNMIFVAAGDFDNREVLAKVRKTFKGFARKRHIPPRMPAEPLPASPRSLTVRDHHFSTARLMVAWPTVSITSPDMYPLDLGAMILGSGRTSRLHKRLVEKEKLAYSVSAGNYTPESRGFFEITARLEEKNVKRVLEIIAEEIEKLRTGSIDPAEIKRVLARSRARDVFRRETVDGLAAELASDFFLTGDAHFGTHYYRRLSKVKAPEVNAALRKYLLPSRRCQVVALPEEKPATSTPAGAPKRKPEKQKVVRVALPAGARMLVYERHDDPIVAVSAVFLGGLRFEPAEKNGVSDIMAKLLPRGTKRYGAEKLAEVVAESGGSLSGYGGRNSFGVSAKFLSSDLELALGLVAEVLTSPTFPQEEVAKRKRHTLARIRQRRESPWAMNELLLDRLLYAPHPYSHRTTGTKASVERLTRADLAAFHRKFCRPDNMVICVAGDVSPRRAEELVRKHLAKFLTPRAEKFVPPAVAAVPELKAARRETQLRPRSKQAVVSLAFRGVSLKDEDRFALRVMRSVLGGMGSRLFNELRDKRSLAYAVGCYLDQGLDPGAVVFYIATKPSQVETSLQAFWREIDRIRSEPVSDEEITRARNSIIGSTVRHRQRSDSIAQGLAYDELYGLKAESFFTEHRKIGKVDKKDVLRVARRYLDKKNYVIAITRPPTDAEEQKDEHKEK
jgi:zinc protease